VTLTQEHHDKANAAMARLGLTRADVVALLIEKHADTVERWAARFGLMAGG
jgi:hypothetical protein